MMTVLFVTQIHRLEDEKQQIEEKLQEACETVKGLREEKKKLQFLLKTSLQEAKFFAENRKDSTHDSMHELTGHYHSNNPLHR